MNELRLFNKSDKRIGLTTRVFTVGEEFDLVNRYVDYLKKKSSKNKVKSTSIFIEPKIESGYPDIVIVEYSKDKMLPFMKQDFKLESKDLKILFECMRVSGQTVNDLSLLLGYSSEDIVSSINRLRGAALIKLSSKEKVYANQTLIKKSISKVISIEAKIDKWNEAIEQASRNLWFATDSYIMLNKESCNEKIMNQCSERGIGIILVNGHISKILKSKSKKFPVSYGSLVFWEWIIRKGRYDETIE